MTPINSFVAMFDFLGFKLLRKQKGTDGLYTLYMNGLLPCIQHSAALKDKTIEKNGKKVCVPDFGPQSVEYRVVSDSILLFAKGDTFDHFFRILSASYHLLCSGFAGPKAPLRGAIGHGDLILANNTIWIGSAIEDAYIGETKQAWSGCVFTISCEKFLIEQGYLEQYKKYLECEMTQEKVEVKRQKLEKVKRQIVKYSIPEQINPKTGPIEYINRDGYALDWTLNVYEGAGDKAFANTSDLHALTIIKNTRDFEKWARKNNI